MFVSRRVWEEENSRFLYPLTKRDKARARRLVAASRELSHRRAVQKPQPSSRMWPIFVTRLWQRPPGGAQGGFLQEPIVNSASSDNINARCCVYVIRGFCHSCVFVVFVTLRESFEKRRPIETSIISLFHRRKVQRQKQTIKDEMASINQADTF